MSLEDEVQKSRRAAVAGRLDAEVDPKNCIVTANELHVPAGREVEIRLQSDNVIHAFWLPQLGAKRDMIPGHVNRIKFTADKTGLYLGQCAEYCSDSHALMKFRVIVDSPEDF
jgi:cytochrome c oxidase subunit 2